MLGIAFVGRHLSTREDDYATALQKLQTLNTSATVHVHRSPKQKNGRAGIPAVAKNGRKPLTFPRFFPEDVINNRRERMNIRDLKARFRGKTNTQPR